jgi:hypothetical protein
MQRGVECISFYRGVQALSVGLNAIFFYEGVQALCVGLSAKVFTKVFKLLVWG